MTEMFLIWAYLTIDSLLRLGLIIFFFLTVVWLIAGMATHQDERFQDINKKAEKYFFQSIKILTVLLILRMVVPNKTEVGYIIGGSVVLNVASSSEAQKLPENVLKAANKFLEGVGEKQK